MSREADYAIKGFLYQFNKTLFEILKASDDSEVTVEGIIEDIEVVNSSSITAIQCKYHEANEHFTLSTVYKPLLQMMHHFKNNSSGKVKYILFAHFPDQTDSSSATIGKNELETTLATTNKDLKQYTDALRGTINLDEFLKTFKIEFGPSYDALVETVCNALEQCGIPKIDIDTLAYPNAIQKIANLSIKHDPLKRKITKQHLIHYLKSVKKTAISRWTLALKSRKQLVDSRRKQLKPNLDKNSRLRYLIIFSNSLNDFDSEIAMFMSDYIDKYHTKPAHISTPILCLDTKEEAFRDIQVRFYKKGIVTNDGYIGNKFVESHFFRDPMSRKEPHKGIQREFSLRILKWENRNILDLHKGDDLFVLGTGDFSDLNTIDVNVEILSTQTLKEIKYLLGVSNVYE
jgi:hypothetical protein